MKVTLSAHSHNPEDRLVGRLDWNIPTNGTIVVDATNEQVAILEADPWVKVVHCDQDSGRAGRRSRE